MIFLSIKNSVHHCVYMSECFLCVYVFFFVFSESEWTRKANEMKTEIQFLLVKDFLFKKFHILSLLSLSFGSTSLFLTHRSIFFVIFFAIFSSVSFRAALEDNIAGIVSQLRVLMNAMNVHAIVMFNLTMLYEFFFLIFSPINTSISSTCNN